MKCREKFVQDHPYADLERVILETCPQDHGIKAVGKMPCLQDTYYPGNNCRACWEREAEETSGPPLASAPTEEDEA